MAQTFVPYISSKSGRHIVYSAFDGEFVASIKTIGARYNRGDDGRSYWSLEANATDEQVQAMADMSADALIRMQRANAAKQAARSARHTSSARAYIGSSLSGGEYRRLASDLGTNAAATMAAQMRG